MKKKTKALISVVAIVLVAFTGIILVGNLGVQALNPAKWEFRSVNDDNLYQAMTFADDEFLANGEKGLTVSIDENRVIKVKGTAEENDVILVGTYKLEAGKSYVFDSNINGSKGSVYLCLVDDETGEVVANCYNTSVVISTDDMMGDTLRLEIVVAENTSLNNLKIKPVLCIGTSAEDLVDYYG